MEQLEFSRRGLSSQLERAAEQHAVRRTKQERALYYEKAALAIIAEYARVRQLSPIAASNMDPDPVRHSDKLTYALIEWLADVELATEAALANLPELQHAWFQLALEEPIPAAQKNEVCFRCGRVYAARHLEMWKYWRRRAAR